MSHTRRTTWALLVFVAISATGLVNAHCPNFCNGHGICSSSDTVSEFCECFESYTGPDCGQRELAIICIVIHILAPPCPWQANAPQPRNGLAFL